ncbi:MAG: DNA polymerase IV [Patescibacteria group bacterium]|nr:DNA polymerase IV [Patescibacteria group bacterium]
MILHIDMNSYFATCEQQANPFLRGKPVAVGGDPRSFHKGEISRSRTLIVAASKEAKKRGVKSVMPSWEAVKICPELIFVPGDHIKYKWITDKFLEIFKSYSPILEIFSIDEAFLDVTKTAKLFGGAENIAKEIKLRLKKEVGEWMTCSIGIAENKLLAKLASDLKKPDGLVIIDENNKEKILNSIELIDFCGIGKRIEARLNRMGIFTVRQLKDCSYINLTKEFKSYGHKLYLIARGEDNSEVMPYYLLPDEKSMGHNFTLPKDVWDLKEIKTVILQLSEKLGRRLRRKNFAAKCVSLLLRYSFNSRVGEKSISNLRFDKPNFHYFHKQKKVNYWINDGYEIYKIACMILEGWQDNQSVRMIGIAVSCLSKVNQISCLEEDNKLKRILKVSDKINNKYGENTIFRGAYLKAEKSKILMPKALKSPVSFMRRSN